jgi:hypothetical protein
VPLSATAAAALCAALLAQGEPEPRASEWTAAPLVEEPPPRSAMSQPSEREPPSTQLVDGMLALGGWGASRYGMGAAGGVLRLSRGTEAIAGGLKGKLVDVGLELAIGETGPGLRIWDALASITVWSSPRRAVRGGLGLDAGAVSYRRVTTGRWEVGGAAGARIALHVDVLPARDRLGFVEVHAGIRALSRGSELSAFALVGLAFRTEAPFVRRGPAGPVEPRDPPPPMVEPAAEPDPWSTAP